LDDTPLVDPCLLHRHVGYEANNTFSFSVFVMRGCTKKILNKHAKTNKQIRSLIFLERKHMMMINPCGGLLTVYGLMHAWGLKDPWLCTVTSVADEEKWAKTGQSACPLEWIHAVKRLHWVVLALLGFSTATLRKPMSVVLGATLASIYSTPRPVLYLWGCTSTIELT
jgi:hypothetical protein